MTKNKTILLVIVLGITTFYSFISLLNEEKYAPYNSTYEKHSKKHDLALGTQKMRPYNSQAIESEANFGRTSTLKGTRQSPPQLPRSFTVVGIKTSSSGNEYPLVLLQYEEGLYEYSVNQYILESEMLLTVIESAAIHLSYQEKTYKISLTPPNLLGDSFKDEEQTYSQMLQMSAHDIGSRPRIIEHIATFTATPYIADAKLVSPGINPFLYKKIGFKTDDLIKTINGKSVTVESEFEAIKQEMYTATTLTFEVMRKGRLITLYLDIPSETLELRRD